VTGSSAIPAAGQKYRETIAAPGNVGTGSRDQAVGKVRRQPGQVRRQLPHLGRRRELNEQVACTAAHERGRAAESRLEPGGPFDGSDRIGGQVQLDPPVRQQHRRDLAAPGREARRQAGLEPPRLPEDVPRGERGVPAQINLRGWGEPAEIPRRRAGRLQERRLRVAQLGRHLLAPAIVTRRIEEDDAGGIARVRAAPRTRRR